MCLRSNGSVADVRSVVSKRRRNAQRGSYNPQHIDNLPPDIRSAIYRRCSTPKALHPFASYSDDSRRIVLHFEHFVCDGDGAYCTVSGCLHQVYGSAGGRYRLLRSYYAPAGD